VNFGWLTGQKYFKENINNDIRQALQKEILDVMDQDIVPFGVISGYQGEVSKDYEIDENGDVWLEDRSRRYPFDDLNWRGKL
jgi:hypothetical protein